MSEVSSILAIVTKHLAKAFAHMSLEIQAMNASDDESEEEDSVPEQKPEEPPPKKPETVFTQSSFAYPGPPATPPPAREDDSVYNPMTQAVETDDDEDDDDEQGGSGNVSYGREERRKAIIECIFNYLSDNTAKENDGLVKKKEIIHHLNRKTQFAIDNGELTSCLNEMREEGFIEGRPGHNGGYRLRI